MLLLLLPLLLLLFVPLKSAWRSVCFVKAFAVQLCCQSGCAAVGASAPAAVSDTSLRIMIWVTAQQSSQSG
jgi:hypothetical protein